MDFYRMYQRDRDADSSVRLLTTNASDKELYRILGLPETATEEEIRAAFKSAARFWHPDLMGETEFFLRIKHAHDVLVDPQKRAIYDETGLDPDDTANKMQVAALGLIRNIAMGILNDGNATVNLVVHIQSSLQGQLAGHTAQLLKAEQKIAKSEKMAANIEKRWKKGASQVKGAIVGMIAAQTQAAQGERSQSQQGIGVVNLAISLMAGADWEPEIPEGRHGIDPLASMYQWNIR
jgi:curved DNA-binding protein CbpA